MVRELLDQVEHAIDRGDYFLALFGTLSLPSICGALESQDGEDRDGRYANWFDTWVGQKYHGSFTGDQCYYFRCAMLHQGRATHPKLGYDRVLFLEPAFATKAGLVLHDNVLNGALNLDVGIFCRDVVEAVKAWLVSAERTPNYQRNFERAFKRYGNGFPPFILGVPVITSGGPVTLSAPKGGAALPAMPRPGFNLHLSLSAQVLANASARAPDKDPMTEVSRVVRSFSEPYFRSWIEILQRGETRLQDAESGTEVVVKRDDVRPAMILTFGPREKAPDWLKEFRLASDLIVPMERAFQFTTAIDKKLGRPDRWGTVNEMVSKIAEVSFSEVPSP